MDELTKFEKIRDTYDISDRNFCMLQSNYVMSLNSIGGGTKVAMIAVALFNRVISNIMFTPKDEDRHKGSIWSNPITVKEIMCDCESSKIIHGGKFETARSNYNKYLKELLDNNVFYRFGRQNFYIYTYEKEVFSWGYMSSGQSYVYPKTIKKILKSRTEMWSRLWNNSKLPGGGSVMSTESFQEDFWNLIEDLISKTPPPVKAKFTEMKRFSKVTSYKAHVERTIEDIADFEGYEEYNTFDEAMLPSSIVDKWAELVPEEVRTNTPGLPKTAAKVRTETSIHVINKHVIETLSEANRLHKDKLKTSKDGYHMLSYLERQVKSSMGITDPDFIIFKNISLEVQNYKLLRDRLYIMGKLDESFLRDWVDWFVRNHAVNRDIGSKYVATIALAKTLNKFIKRQRTPKTVSNINSSLYDEIRSFYTVGVSLEEACIKYGPFVIFSFMAVSFGLSEAKSMMNNMLDDLELMGQEHRYVKLVEMSTTMTSHPHRQGLMKEAAELLNKMIALLKKYNANPTKLGLKLKKGSDTIYDEYWRKIEYEWNSKQATT